MEAEIAEKYNAEITLVAGSGGVYEIEVDGKLIFSKQSLGRFPEEGEVDRLLADL